MAPTITSFTPAGGPVTGGTEVTITGTGLDDVTVVLVGNDEAEIVGTPTATSLTFRTPAGPAGNAAVAVYDGTEMVAAGAQFAYAAVPADDVLVTQLAGRYALDVNTGTYDTPTWLRVRGVTTIQRAMNYTNEDDSDTDSGAWDSTLDTSLGWTITGTCKRGRGKVSGAFDPGQEALRVAGDSLGAAHVVDVRYYDRAAVSVDDEAKRGFATSQWAPQGGNKTGDKVNFTLTGQGALTDIDNPVIADPSLAGPYAAA
jgi:hypothetical protein